MRRAKIVATIGPASNTVEKLCDLINVGLNVCRINMSHGTYEGHSQTIKNIREASNYVISGNNSSYPLRARSNGRVV